MDLCMIGNEVKNDSSNVDQIPVTSLRSMATLGETRKYVNFRTLLAPAGSGADVAISKESTLDVNIIKVDVCNILIWVKFYDIPITAFTKDGFSAIATKLGIPLMLDSYTAAMCMDYWGWSNYAKAMVKLQVDVELKDTIVVDVLKFAGGGYTMNIIHVEYEWTPPKCSICQVFSHVLDECPKKIVLDVLKNPRQAIRGGVVGSKTSPEAFGSPTTTPLGKMINDLERQMLDEKLMLVGPDGKPLKRVNDSVIVNCDSEVEEVFNKTIPQTGTSSGVRSTEEIDITISYLNSKFSSISNALEEIRSAIVGGKNHLNRKGNKCANHRSRTNFDDEEEGEETLDEYNRGPSRGDRPKTMVGRNVNPRGYGERPSYWPKTEITNFAGNIDIESVLDWLYELHKFFDIMEVLEEEQVKVVAYKLSGGAGAWWQHEQDNRRTQGRLPVDTWIRIKRMIKAQNMAMKAERMAAKTKVGFKRSNMEGLSNYRSRPNQIQSTTHGTTTTTSSLKLVEVEWTRIKKANRLIQTLMLDKQVPSVSGLVKWGIVSKAFVKAFKLPTEPHPSPYQIWWIKKGPTLKVTEICKLPLAIWKHYNELVTCDVVDMEACHVLLGRPWKHDVDSTHQGIEDILENAISIVVKPLLAEFDKTMADDTPDTLLPLRNIQHQIDLVPEASLPNLPYYKISSKESKILREKIEELLKKGHIQALVLMWFWRFLHQRRMIVGGCALIVKQSAKSWQGIILLFREFLRNFSSIVAPITNCLKMGPFHWTKKAEESFKIIKKLKTTPVLSLPNFDKVFELESDACGIRIGAVLSQEGRLLEIQKRLGHS
nr:hypothetical protein [Tanacetum cinerariifolium]